MQDGPGLTPLRQRLDEEARAYADVLAAVDRLAQFRLPLENLPDVPELRRRLAAFYTTPPAPPAGGLLRGLWLRLRDRLTAHLTPRLDRQLELDAVLIRLLDGQIDEGARLHTELRELAAALVRYLQRVEPLVDARDRLSSALATTRSELILEAFDRRLESLTRRVDGLHALRERLEAVGAETRALRETLAESAPPPAVAAAALGAAEDAAYVAFENRFRGSREEIRERLTPYVALLREATPVIDLGCGRGELLELLHEAGIDARGVDGNASCVADCRARGLDVLQGDLVAFLRSLETASLGAVAAVQVAEHLPPRVLGELLRESQRALRPGGLLILETVNPRSVVGFLDVYTRDLSHERPLHPDTLRFLAAAAGFGDVRIEWRSPVEPAARLASVPVEGLPAATAQTLNENVERLNALLYAPQEYALIARR